MSAIICCRACLNVTNQMQQIDVRFKQPQQVTQRVSNAFSKYGILSFSSYFHSRELSSLSKIHYNIDFGPKLHQKISNKYYE